MLSLAISRAAMKKRFFSETQQKEEIGETASFGPSIVGNRSGLREKAEHLSRRQGVLGGLLWQNCPKMQE